MLSFSYRSLLAVSLVLVTALSTSAQTSPSQPTSSQIAQWVEQLGDNDFMARENASKKLWQAGSAAETALEKATKSGDPEVVRRSRELLDKFRWGIYPDTPANIVALIRAYQSGNGEPRQEAVQQLLDSGDEGLKAVLKIATAEKDDDQRKDVGVLIAARLPLLFLQAGAENKYEHFEHLLELGHEGKFVSPVQYVAYCLLRDKLVEAINRFTAKLREQPGDAWTAETLVYLHRANGDLVQARKAAEKSGRTDLVECILYEAGDWKALSVLAENSGSARMGNNGEYSIVRPRTPAEKWAFRSSYARLAGRDKTFEKAIRELRKLAEAKEERESSAFAAAKALLLNDRPVEGMDLLRTLPGQNVLLFDTLCTRLDFNAAMELATKRLSNAKNTASLEFARARALCLLGEKREGESLFDHYAERIKEGVDPDWISSLLAEEMRAGLRERAFAHAAKAMLVATTNGKRSEGETLAHDYLKHLFPQRESTAEVWWIVLRRKFKDESLEASLNRLHKLLEGKIAANDMKTWIEVDSSGQLGILSWDIVPEPRREVWAQAVAEVASRAGLDDLAFAALKQQPTRDDLIQLGDLLVAKKQWAEAVERYRQAWKKEWPTKRSRDSYPSYAIRTPDPLPLYLAGDALLHAGQEKEGKEHIEQSHRVPLADAATRYNFMRALTQRGHIQAAQREAERILRVGELGSFYSGEALRLAGFAAQKRKEYRKAALCFEQSMLRCLHLGTNFLSTAAYVNVPAQIHLLHAQDLLASNEIDEALKQAELALKAAPGYVNLPIALVPELERRGHTKEATNLFNRCNEAYEKVCQAYPRCAWAHNSVAWMSACCRRNLEVGLHHAEKAVELTPGNAGYLDTLAEVHFQRGERDKAIAAQKRAIELDSRREYYRKQLKRLEAGDPSAERPLEDDE